MKRFLIILLIVTGSLYSNDNILKRYGIVVGCNIGGNNTENLRYSITDAEKFTTVLTTLGGADKENITLLKNPDKQELYESFKAMATQLKTVATGRKEVIFYYSGHSDKNGLLLHGENYSYEELKNEIDNLDTDVKIVVLDSCFSGEYTRFKGGVRKPPFVFDTSADTRGRAVLTSSSGNEESQESDLYGSSFFSHALITGLRGAADSNGDKKVTINEAYQYAFDETLEKTESVGRVTQHPAYDIELKGTGNLVITDLDSPSSKLIFSKEYRGNVAIRRSNGDLVAEFHKKTGSSLELAIESGDYKISLDVEDKKLSGKFSVCENEEIYSDNLKLRKKQTVFTLFKGEDLFRGFYPIGYNYVNSSGVGRFSFSLWGGKLANYKGLNSGLIYSYGTGESYGYQGALAINIDRGELAGVQFTTLLNLADKFSGVQLGSVNIGESVNGFQFGIINSNKEFKGFQAGIYNNSSTFKGFQFGLINYLKKGSGVQLGIINISEELNGLPIGLLDIQLNGENYFQTWFEGELEEAYLFSSYRFGSRFLYKQFTIGSGVVGANSFLKGSLGFDLGLRIPFINNNLSFLNDIGIEIKSNSGVNIDKFYNLLVPKFSNRLELKIGEKAGLFVGVNSRVYVDGLNRVIKPISAREFLNPLGLCYLDHKLIIGFEFR